MKTYSCLEYRPSSISASLPFLAIPWGETTGGAISLCCYFYPKCTTYVPVLTLAGVWDRSVLTELEEEQWDPVFVSVPDKRRFLDSGELDICTFSNQDTTKADQCCHFTFTNLNQFIYKSEHEKTVSTCLYLKTAIIDKYIAMMWFNYFKHPKHSIPFMFKRGFLV